MKETIFFPFCLFFLIGMLQSQSVTLTRPNNGESWPARYTQRIQWTYSGIPDTALVKLVLFKGGIAPVNKIGNIVQNIPIGSRVAVGRNWNVGDYEGGTAAAGSGYYIRIISMDGSFRDESDRPFTIGAFPALRLTSPRGGEVWKFGSSHAISWSSSTVGGKISIVLYKGDHWVAALDLQQVSLGSRLWVWSPAIPISAAPPVTIVLAPGNDYWLRIHSAADPRISDSGGHFTLER